VNEDEQVKELSGTDSFSFGDPFLYYIEDNKCVINLMKEEVKRPANKVRDEQDLFDKRECSYKEEITRLKT